MDSDTALKTYRAKRNFSITAEPSGAEKNDLSAAGTLTFVVQKHWASRLHYDFRLELDGTMKSWAVPKGPSFDTHDKRLAMHVEDHPISYSSFEGTIPSGQYGAGKVIVWDKGTWEPIGDAAKGYKDGNLKFELRGHKLRGKWALVRMKGRGEKQEPWLLIKEKDEFMRPATEFSVVDELPDSVGKLGLPGAARAGRAASATREDTKARATKATTKAAARPAQADEDAALAAAAPKAALPKTLAPQLATLVGRPPSDPEDWVYEIKFDGYRLLARVDENGTVQLFTRNGNDWTSKLGPLHKELTKLALPPGWYDGEIVVHNAEGVPDFGALQQSFDVSKTGSIVYYLFDLPYCGGRDLRELPLVQRRALLQTVLAKTPSERVRFSEVFDAPPESVVQSACRLGLEGIIAKRRDSVYVTRRSGDWIKLKCSQRQEFVIGGYTDPQGARTGIGSLLLGVHDKAGRLVYAGNVGTGFNERTLADIASRLKALKADKSPFGDEKIEGRPHWVKPELVAEVTFGEWTRANRIRHSVFHGLRTDKEPDMIVREKPAAIPKASPATRANEKKAEVAEVAEEQAAKESARVTANSTDRAGESAARSSRPPRTRPVAEPSHALSTRLKVTHPERVVDESTGATKLEVVRYYGLVAPLMMAHLKDDRPISLVRAPGGIGKQLFFQKHAEVEKLPGLKSLDPKLDPDHDSMLAVASEQGLLSAAQWNTIEVHSTNGVASDWDHPDRMVFDLDPGEGVKWPQLQEAAVLVQAFLEQLGLPAFLKTSGGKGLHLVVPIRKQYGWDTVKGFSQAVVQHLSTTIPQRFVAKSGPRNRVGKIFIDYLRNGQGATTVAAWSARARPGMGISVPLAWDELKGLDKSDHWNIRNAHSRLDQGNKPWDGYARAAKSLTSAMKTLGFVPGKT